MGHIFIFYTHKPPKQVFFFGGGGSKLETNFVWENDSASLNVSSMHLILLVF